MCSYDETAALRSSSVWDGAARAFDRERLVKSAVERVRRHFGRRNRARGNKYARVAYAYFKRRGWRKTGLPRRTFFHALKKVKVFFICLQTKAKPTSAWCRGRKPLH